MAYSGTDRTSYWICTTDPDLASPPAHFGGILRGTVTSLRAAGHWSLLQGSRLQCCYRPGGCTWISCRFWSSGRITIQGYPSFPPLRAFSPAFHSPFWILIHLFIHEPCNCGSLLQSRVNKSRFCLQKAYSPVQEKDKSTVISIRARAVPHNTLVSWVLGYLNREGLIKEWRWHV